MVILIVDDEHEIANVIATSLGLEGHTTITANNGLEALEILKTTTPQVILLDLMMPSVSGPAFLKALQTEGKRTHYRVIVMSASIDLPEKAAAIGADGYLAKPFELDTLDLCLSPSLAH